MTDDLFAQEHARGLHAGSPVSACSTCASSPPQPALPPSSAPSRLEAAFARLRARMIVDQPDEPEPPPSCPACHGAGFVRRAVERSDPDFGRALPCTVCGDVARRRALRILDALPVHFRTTTLETFPRDTVTQRAIVRAVEAWERQDDRPWLYLHGPPGRGKTGLAVAVLRRAGERGASINFTVVPELLLKLRATYDHADGAGTELDLLSALASVDVLLLDDLAANRGTEWAAERLFDVLGPRYERRLRTLLTSNLDLDQLEQHLGHARLVSRIVESADILTVERLPNLRSVRVLRSTGTA